ncbi:MAG: precorrin-4 C(11)-methyltransferase [Cyanobacteriota bacterium]|nr:precorrin-4 C(11)-methyltransferase [Cyanobacteriota bacterium]
METILPTTILPTTTHPVWIVGAGPGDPDLITLRGQKILAMADVVVYAGSLVPESLLAHCQPQAERLDSRSLVLEEMVAMISERVAAGQKVVRLQDGDPCLYGALQELLRELQQRQIAVEIVPGVSAFQLAAARLQVELTIPERVQTIILTRANGRTHVPPKEELASLAAHQASLCLYLSAHHCRAACQQLLAHYPADTPIAICYRLGWPDEQVILGSLVEMADLTQQQQLTRTVLYVISPALAEATPQRSRLYSQEHAHLFRPSRPQSSPREGYSARKAE